MRLMERFKAAIGVSGSKPPAKPAPDRQILAIPTMFLSTDAVEGRMLNDDTVWSVFNVFSDVLLGGGWHWEGDDAEAVQHLTDAITYADGWEQLLDEIAARPFARYAAAEIVWKTAPDWVPAKYRVLPHDSVTVDLDELQALKTLHVLTTAGMQDLPAENALFAPYRPTFSDPLGTSVYPRIREVLGFKRRTDEACVKFVERFAVPTAIGWYQPGTSKAEQTKLLEALRVLQSASVGTLPGPKGDDGNSVEVLEAKASGNIQFAGEQLASYERRIARAVLGSVLAIFESQFGTRAQAETHLEVLKAVLASYQEDIAKPINEQIVRPVMLYNVGEKDVRLCLNAPSFDDLQKVGQWVADLATAGIIDPIRDANAVRARFGLEELEQTELDAMEADKQQEKDAAAALAEARAKAPAGPQGPPASGAADSGAQE